jgi:predicted transcriptional regulator
MAVPARSLREGRNIPAHPDDVRQGLREARQRRSDAERARAEAMADTAAWLIAGDETQLSVSELARLSGLTRRTVYALLREQAADG